MLSVPFFLRLKVGCCEGLRDKTFAFNYFIIILFVCSTVRMQRRHQRRVRSCSFSSGFGASSESSMVSRR